MVHSQNARHRSVRTLPPYTARLHADARGDWRRIRGESEVQPSTACFRTLACMIRVCATALCRERHRPGDWSSGKVVWLAASNCPPTNLSLPTQMLVNKPGQQIRQWGLATRAQDQPHPDARSRPRPRSVHMVAVVRVRAIDMGLHVVSATLTSTLASGSLAIASASLGTLFGLHTGNLNERNIHQ